jgi:hypothetical protein
MTPKEKFDRLKELLPHDERMLLIDVANSIRYSAYDAGYQAGLTAFAWWKNGQQNVGTCGTTLKSALEKRKSGYGYSPDRVDILPDHPCNEPVWKNVTSDFEREQGGERWMRTLDATCWISVLHRLTGFGYMEWETALVFLHEVKDRSRTWKDRDCLIIAGDRRDELDSMPKEELREWYAANIDGNRNSMETIIETLRP